MPSDGGFGDRPALLAGFASGTRWSYRSAVHRLLGSPQPDDLSFGSTPPLPPATFEYVGQRSSGDWWTDRAAVDASRSTIVHRADPLPAAPPVPVATRRVSVPEQVDITRVAEEQPRGPDPDSNSTPVVPLRADVTSHGLLEVARSAPAVAAAPSARAATAFPRAITPQLVGPPSSADRPAPNGARVTSHLAGPGMPSVRPEGILIQPGAVSVPAAEFSIPPRPADDPAPTLDRMDPPVATHPAPRQPRRAVDRLETAVADRDRGPVAADLGPGSTPTPRRRVAVPEPQNPSRRIMPQTQPPAMPGPPVDRPLPVAEPAHQAFQPRTNSGVDRMPARLPQPRVADPPALQSPEPRAVSPRHQTRNAERIRSLLVTPVPPRRTVPRSFWASSALRSTHRGVLR